MKRYFLIILIFTGIFQAIGKQPVPSNKPKIVIGLVIDQMRWDYLYRYAEQYGTTGFKRLMKDGYNCQNTMVNYIPTFTGPGHACIYTGSVPSIHGIAANDWISNFTYKKSYCVTDDSVRTITNGDTAAGKSMSPKNLLTTTITDELRLATNFGSKVYGIAIKDRGSILPAGHLASGAYWLDDSTGNFCSSTFYKKHSSPAWLKQFNARHVPDSLIKKGWYLSDPSERIYAQSTADDNKYEGKFTGENAPVFPHKFNSLTGKSKYDAFKATPGSNFLTFEAAKACIAGAHLGSGDFTDFLCISLSGTDYAGHQFGPNSMEIEDMYIRLDQEIGSFLQYLDATIGAGNYLFFLTADHGGAHNPQFLIDNDIPAGFLAKDIRSGLNAYLKNLYNQDSLVAAFTNYQFYLDEIALTFAELDRNKVKESMVHWLNRRAEFAYVIDLEHIDHTPLPEPIHTMVVNGYCHGRSGCIEVIPNPGIIDNKDKTGTTHGTWNPYDAHIPLLWYGWNIRSGETHAVVNMTDISATLAALLHIQMPNGCIGKPIKGIVK